MNWSPQIAQDRHIAALEELIPISVRTLQAAYYSHEQMNGALGTVFAVDRQLIERGLTRTVWTESIPLDRVFEPAAHLGLHARISARIY